MSENSVFWENEEKKLDERIYAATWPGGQKAVDTTLEKMAGQNGAAETTMGTTT